MTNGSLRCYRGIKHNSPTVRQAVNGSNKLNAEIAITQEQGNLPYRRRCIRLWVLDGQRSDVYIGQGRSVYYRCVLHPLQIGGRGLLVLI